MNYNDVGQSIKDLGGDDTNPILVQIPNGETLTIAGVTVAVGATILNLNAPENVTPPA